MALGGDSYLTFMGNEFGHPEWIDFPRDDTYDTSTGAFVPGRAQAITSSLNPRWYCSFESLQELTNPPKECV